jgi:uncharacterized protein
MCTSVKTCVAFFGRKAAITTKIAKGADPEKAKKFEQYLDWSENLSKAPSHRLLAMLRAENEGVIKFSVDIEDKDEAIDFMEQAIIKNKRETATQLKKARRQLQTLVGSRH